MDDGLIQNILARSLGDRFSRFATADRPDSVGPLEPFESILYSLDKRDLIRLLEVIQAFSTILSPRLALHSMVKKITEILDVSHCSLILLDREEETGTVAISHEDPDFEGVRISLGDYPEIRRSLQTGNITVVENPSMDPLMHSLKKDQINKIKDVSIMVLPLLFQEQVFGVLLVRKQMSEEGFTIREVRICQLMVRMVLSALQRMYCAVLPGLPAGSPAWEPSTPPTDGGPRTADLHRALFLSGPVGVLLLDKEDRIREANPRAVELLGIDRDRLLSMGYRDIVSEEWIERIRRMRKADSPEQKGLSRYYFRYQAPAGQKSVLSVERHALPGEGAYTLVFFRDGTKEKQMEEHLQQQAQELTAINKSLHEARADLLARNDGLLAANERLDEINKRKTHFLAVATHEIRTPLNIIMGYNRFLLQERPGALNPEQKRILEESVQSCERLLNIVNEMLDFSRIESGKLKLQNQQSDVLGLLRRVYRQMKMIADREKIDLSLDLPEVPAILIHDPDRIEQVLVNLISNAIKFTPSGGSITLSARERTKHGRGLLEIAISDTGVGLSGSMLEKLFKGFQPFLPPESGPSERKNVGLGLAISKKIVEAHGGEIWAEGAEGEGATFRFTLPLPLEAQVPRERNLSA
jgi:PAS domain S-box-containing protein